MARGLAERLKLSGFAVDIESDGASAAQTALLEPYSLIILDINLPNVSGFEVLHKIRQTGSTVPVMILTARYAIDDKVSGLDLGADDYEWPASRIATARICRAGSADDPCRQARVQGPLDRGGVRLRRTGSAERG